LVRSTPHRFSPIKLLLPGSGEILTIKSVRDALKALVHDWPETTGESYMLALQTCIDAIAERASSELAREALIGAAAEAGIPVMS